MYDPASRALLMILHGSPRPVANEPAIRIAKSFEENGQFAFVTVAYLECNIPSIPEAIAECAGRGIKQIVAVPYFLHTGRHQVLDVPGFLIQGAADHPGLSIIMTDPVGTSELVADALATRAQEA